MKTARIDLHPCGYFIAAARTVGSSDEELAAIEADPTILTPQRKEALNFIVTHAMYALHTTVPMGIG